MHIPDGFLDGKTTVVTWAAAVAGVAWAAHRARRVLEPRQVPLLGVTAAFVFAAQMLNFPVIGGTSGHLLGGVLAGALVGPSGGVLVIASVLIVQCLVFADGGLLSLGANIFDMALLGSAGACGIYGVIRRGTGSLRRQIAAAAFASWCSVVLAATACAILLAVSGTARWGVVFPAMAGVHMLIGVGEAVITALVLAAIAATRPDLLRGRTLPGSAAAWKDALGYGLLIAVVVGGLLSPWASSLPDGLQRVAADLGFVSRAAEVGLPGAPLRDYVMPGVRSPAMATALAGALGTVLMFGFALVLGRMVVPARREEETRTGDDRQVPGGEGRR